MNLDLDERVVIVTGGSSGIGYAIASAFAKERARVVITARRADALEMAARELTAQSGNPVVGIPSDTTDQSLVDRMVAEVQARYSRIDILVTAPPRPRGWHAIGSRNSTPLLSSKTSTSKWSAMLAAAGQSCRS